MKYWIGCPVDQVEAGLWYGCDSMTEQLFIVDGIFEINKAIQLHVLYSQIWVDKCQSIKDSFFIKTSRVATDLAKTNFKEYTYWYRTKPDYGIESYGKERPDIESYYPPKPEHPIQFEYEGIDGKHILVSYADFEGNRDLFGESYIFPFKSHLFTRGGSDINV